MQQLLKKDLDKDISRLGKRVAKVYEEIQPLIDKEIAVTPVTCEMGCSDCCRLLTLATLPEAVVIASYVMQEPVWALQIESLLAKVYRQIEFFQDPELSAKTYGRKGIPCIFLNEETNKCRIYDCRPVACRTHFVTSPPADCDSTQEKQIQIVDLKRLQRIVFTEASHVSKQVGTPVGLAPLAVSFLWAMKGLAEGPRVILQSMSPEWGRMGLGFWSQQIDGSL